MSLANQLVRYDLLGTESREMSGLLNRRSLLGGVFGLLAGAGRSFALAKSDAEAEAYVAAITKEVIQLANSGTGGKELRVKFAALLNRYVNLRGVANFALGPYQKQLPAADKEMFYELVTNYAAALFVYYVDDFRGTGLEIKDTAKQGSFLTIQSAIKLKGGGNEQVRWRLQPGGGKGYRVADVNLKGVWMTISMKKRFGDVLNRSKGDFRPLYDELREAETW
jgi:ABC-type transporter MlaC component